MPSKYFSNDVFQNILRAAMPTLAASWDGEPDRVAYIEEGERPQFIPRALAIEHVATAYAGNDAAAAAALEALEGGVGPAYFICMIEGWGASEVLRLGVADLVRYRTGDFGVTNPEGDRKMEMAATDPRFAAALIEGAARKLPGAASLPEVVSAVQALRETPGDSRTIQASLRAAVVACRPFYGTTDGQTMGMVLNAVMRATTAAPAAC